MVWSPRMGEVPETQFHTEPRVVSQACDLALRRLREEDFELEARLSYSETLSQTNEL